MNEKGHDTFDRLLLMKLLLSLNGFVFLSPMNVIRILTPIRRTISEIRMYSYLKIVFF